MILSYPIIFLCLITLVSSQKNATNTNATSAKPLALPPTPHVQEQFYLDPNWPSREVSALQVFGSSLALDEEHGSLILLHRGYHDPKRESLIKENTVAVMDKKSGKFLREWGNNKFSKPHGLFLTKSGDIFITDTVMQQVFKFEADPTTKLWKEKPALTLGKPFSPGYDKTHLCGPSDVVEVPETGDFFVSEGYCPKSSRIIKFDKKGQFLFQFDSPTAPYLSGSHALALARSDKMNSSELLLLVADRDNGRVQVFNMNGQFRYEIGPGTFGETAKIFNMATTNAYNPDKKFEYGFVHIVNGGLPVGQAKVFTLGLTSHNATLLSSFKVSEPKEKQPQKDEKKDKKGPGHDQSQDHSKHSSSVNTTLTKNSTTAANKTGKDNQEPPKLESPHDIVVSKDGKEIFIVEANHDLRLKRFVKGPKPLKPSGDGPGHKGKGSGVTIMPSHFDFFGAAIFYIFADGLLQNFL